MNYKILNSNKGISVIEVVVATAILGILVSGIMSLKTVVYKLSQGVVQRSSVTRVIFSVQEELVKDLDNMPFRKNVAFIQGNNLNKAAYEASFDDAEAQQGCYDKDGRSIPVTPDPSCEVRLSFYRVQELDRNYAAIPGALSSTVPYVPMSRLVMRIIFKDSSTGAPRTLYLSRLKTHVLSY